MVIVRKYAKAIYMHQDNFWAAIKFMFQVTNLIPENNQLRYTERAAQGQFMSKK